MSREAVAYAFARAADAGPPTRRLVFFLLAERANMHCGTVLSGDWLDQAVGIHSDNVGRHVAALEAAGLVTVRRREGLARAIRFPVAVAIPNPLHQCGGCRAWNARSHPTHTSDTPDADVGHPRHQRRGNPFLSVDIPADPDGPAIEYGTKGAGARMRELAERARLEAVS